jgi:hypothetical protein
VTPSGERTPTQEMRTARINYQMMTGKLFTSEEQKDAAETFSQDFAPSTDKRDEDEEAGLLQIEANGH